MDVGVVSPEDLRALRDTWRAFYGLSLVAPDEADELLAGLSADELLTLVLGAVVAQRGLEVRK